MSRYERCIWAQEGSKVPNEWCFLNHSAVALRKSNGSAWYWQNDRLPELDDLRTCLRKKRFLFSGDSLTRQQARTLRCWASAADVLLDVEVATRTHLLDVPLEGGQIFDSDWMPESGSDFVINRIESNKLDGLVVNCGHHLHYNPRAEELYRNIIVKEIALIEAAIAKQTRLKPENVIFRTVSPRHLIDGEWNDLRCKCTAGQLEAHQRGEPVDCGCCRRDQPDFEATMDSYQGTAITQYQNAVLRELVPASRFTLLDVEHISLPRVDNHNNFDCAHFCLPGCPDAWNAELMVHLCAIE